MLDDPGMLRGQARTSALVGLSLIVLVAAGCGKPKPARPAGVGKPLSPAASALATFDSAGCGQCHRYAPAKATGTIGPNLDKLKEAAAADGIPLAQFVYQAITDPNGYVAPGYQAGVMPGDYQSSIPADKLTELVNFLAAHTK
jgi:cytochrome c551/c552